MPSLSTQKRLGQYVAEDRFLFAAGFLAMIAATAGQLAGPLLLRSIIDHSIPEKDASGLLLRAGGFLASVAVIGVLGYVQNMTIAKLGLNIVTRIKKDLFDHLLTLPVGWFDAHPVGELISRTESDTEKLREFFSRTGISLAANVLFFSGMMAVCFFLEPGITLWICAALPFLVAFVFLYFDRLRKRYEKTRSLYASITAMVTEFLQGIEVIKAFGRTAWAESKLDGTARKKRDNDVRTFMSERIAMSVLGFFIGPFFIFLVVRSLAPRILSGVLTIGTLLVFIDYGRRLLEPLMEIADNVRGLQQARVSLGRVFGILALEPEYSGRGTELAEIERGIEFRNVWFRYKEEWVLRDVSFSIPAGSMTALVGPSGSGKSTAIGLLCRFYKPEKGSITVDGIPLDDIDLYSWRRAIGLVMQDVFLFPGPVLENVRVYDSDIDEATVRRALAMVQAGDFVNLLPQGINSGLMERGSNLSSGEKQLLSFARALTADPQIIVLDEATASIDAKTENRIRAAMADLLRGRTSVVVAHRLSSVINAAQILFFKDGEITARGNHGTLMAGCTDYARLVSLQFPGNGAGPGRDSGESAP